MTIFLIPNSKKPFAFEVCVNAVKLLSKTGVKLLLADECKSKMPDDLPVEYLEEKKAFMQCDIVVTVGGDGTILHAARHTMLLNKPLLGINVGQLGFLAMVESDELKKLLRLPVGDYVVENRSAIQANYEDHAFLDHAINDIILFKETPEKTIALDIFCDDILVSSFRGDGVIFATPTGSTAYSLSAGGSIIDARINVILVTPICPHLVYTPPMVFAADRELKVVSKLSPDECVLIGFDGVKSRPISHDIPLIIRQSELTVPLIQFHDADQLKSIDKKLKGR